MNVGHPMTRAMALNYCAMTGPAREVGDAARKQN